MIALKLGPVRDMRGKPRLDDLSGAIRERLLGDRIPKRSRTGKLGQAAGFRRPVHRERIDDRAVVADDELHMREIGISGVADVAQPVAAADTISVLNADAARAQVAVLRFPAV